MWVAFVGDDRFTEINLVSIFSSEIHFQGMGIILMGFVVLVGMEGLRIIFFKDAEKVGFEKIIIGIDVMLN